MSSSTRATTGRAVACARDLLTGNWQIVRYPEVTLLTGDPDCYHCQYDAFCGTVSVNAGSLLSRMQDTLKSGRLCGMT
jgi:hypothetical protein